MSKRLHGQLSSVNMYECLCMQTHTCTDDQGSTLAKEKINLKTRAHAGVKLGSRVGFVRAQVNIILHA